MSTQTEQLKTSNKSLAGKFVENIHKARIATMTIGFILAISLFILGYILTQQDLEQKAGQESALLESDISMDFKASKFILKNTAPGIILIICGTFIAITTINKTTWVKTQWENKEKGIPGSTEVKG